MDNSEFTVMNRRVKVCSDRRQTEELLKIHTYKPRIFDKVRSVCAKRGLFEISKLTSAVSRG